MNTLNGPFMATAYDEASGKGWDKKGRKRTGGMDSAVPTTLTRGMTIHRFGNTGESGLYLTGSWWIGFSPFEA